MNYIQSNLLPNEKIIFTARIHDAIFIPTLAFLFLSMIWICYTTFLTIQNPGSQLLMIFFGFFLLFCTSLLGIKSLIIRQTTEFAITNKRIIAKSGLIRIRTLELFLNKVESVGVFQNNVGARLLNYGTVIIRGTGGTREGFEGLSDPFTIRRKVNEVIQYYNTESHSQQNRNQTGLEPEHA